MRSNYLNRKAFTPLEGPRVAGTQILAGRRTRTHGTLFLTGFTLAEAMMATVMLGIAAAGVLLPFTSGAAVRVEGEHRTLAAKLAGELMEEVIRSPFDQIAAGYDGYSEPQGQVKDASGALFTDSNYANFSRDVSCNYVYVPQQSGAGNSKFILATVRVYYSGKQMATINRLISE